jgi:nucleoside-diphosphate-sugar epimerase
MTILLTGSTGFLGSALLPLLLDVGWDVTTLGRKPPRLEHPHLHYVQTDFGSGIADVPVAWDKVDAVLHLAAAGVKSSRRKWPEAVDFNVVGTQRLLEMVAARASRRPVFVMARAFYEHMVQQSPGLLENPYIATKRAAADLVRIWSVCYPGPVALATVFQVYGPGDDSANVLPYAARSFAQGSRAEFGSGRGRRDWVFIEDAARAFMAVLDCAATSPWNGLREYDIGTGQLRTIRGMIEELAQIAGVDPAAACDFDASRDRPDADIVLAAAKRPAEWVPRIGTPEGLGALWQSHLKGIAKP